MDLEPVAIKHAQENVESIDERESKNGLQVDTGCEETGSAEIHATYIIKATETRGSRRINPARLIR